LCERYQARVLLTVGPVIVGAGLALFAVPGIGQSYWTGFFPAMCVLGFGMAVSVAPLTTTVMQSAEERFSGVASGINNATSRVAGMLAVALLGAIAVGVFRADLSQRLAATHASQQLQTAMQAEASKLVEAKLPPVRDARQRQQLTQVMHESFVGSFRVVILLSAGTALLSAICAWLTIRRARQS
jgi:hypothetical protein